jgi:hypothetical protein
MTTEQTKPQQLKTFDEPKKAKFQSTELTDADLEKVAGGRRGNDDDLHDLEIQR